VEAHQVRAGKLDRRVDIQRNTPTTSDSGEQIETWADVAFNIPASFAPLSGDERFSVPQNIATDQVEFRIRYSSVVASLSPLDRVIYPSRGTASPPPEVTVYDILQATEIGRREGVRILAARRPDITGS
jgi:SPP1 family predicted phage head-tail adaptor